MPRDEAERRDATTRALVGGWIVALSELVDVVERDLAEPGRSARLEADMQATRAGALALLSQDGVRRETLTAIERITNLAAQEARAAIGEVA